MSFKRAHAVDDLCFIPSTRKMSGCKISFSKNVFEIIVSYLKKIIHKSNEKET